MSLVTFLQLFQSLSIVLLISLSNLPDASIIDSKYVRLATLLSWIPFIYRTYSLVLPLFTVIYIVLLPLIFRPNFSNSSLYYINLFNSIFYFLSTKWFRYYIEHTMIDFLSQFSLAHKTLFWKQRQLEADLWWRTILTSKLPVVLTVLFTLIFNSRYVFLIMPVYFSGIPASCKYFYNSTLDILSYAFSKSKKTMCKTCCFT